MAIFNSTQPSYQGPTTVTTAATQIYNTVGTPISSPAAPTEFPTGAALSEITVVNTGPATVWVGSSTVSGTEGTPLKAGEQLTIRGTGHVAGETGSSSWNLWAITSSGSAVVQASLATVDATV
jgi:hypothetical protein